MRGPLTTASSIPQIAKLLLDLKNVSPHQPHIFQLVSKRIVKELSKRQVSFEYFFE